MTARPARHVVIFARAPALGVGKRRLARDIGRLAAHRFARAALTGTIRKLDRPGWTLWIAVSTSRDRAHPIFAGRRLLVQPRGDLGARMTGVFRALPPGPAVLIGSDIPEVDAGDIHKAFAALGRADAVFGPATDGGYWLVGLRRTRPLPHRFMADVRWSTPSALDDTLATLPPAYRVARLRLLDDVDDGASWRAWQARGRTQESP